MAAGKLGSKPVVHSLKTVRKAIVLARALDALGPAPDISPGYSALVEKLTGGDWQIEGNDRYGDCVFADVAHRLMLWTAQGSGTMVVPTTQETLNLYSEATGFDPINPLSDQGADPAEVAGFVEQHGFMVGGRLYKSDGHGIIDPANTDHIKWAIILFGCAPLAFNLPQSAMDQFDAGRPWDVSGNGTIKGGHDVLGVEFQPDEPCWQLITWGKRWSATSAFVAKYLRDCVPVVSHDFLTASGQAPSGIDLDQMLADLRAVQ